MKSVLKEEGYPLILFSTYMSMILGSIGSKQYQHLFVRSPSGPEDVTAGGNFSCAYYVSSILVLCNLIQNGVHTTVDGLLCDMLKSGWVVMDKVEVGSVVVWGEGSLCSDGRFHRHIGFFVGEGQAVSNHPRLCVPKQHDVTFGARKGQPIRPIQEIYTCPKLTQSMR